MRPARLVSFAFLYTTSVSKKFMLKRVMSRFFVEFFCLAVPKNFAWEPFCAVFQKISGSEKVYR